MSNIVTAKRLAEIKTQLVHRPDAVREDLIATLERAVELVRAMNDARNEYGLTFVPVSATEFLREFDR